MHAVIVWIALASPPEIAPPPRLVDPHRAINHSLRWVLRFKVENGKDYVDQLRMLDAVVGIPIPDRKQLLLVKDLAAPKKHRIATDDEINALAEKVRFSERRIDAVRQVAVELGLDFTPEAFWAFLPRSVEEELLRKELSYQNRRFEEIEETIFRITIRDGKPQITVDAQVLKKSP